MYDIINRIKSLLQKVMAWHSFVPITTKFIHNQKWEKCRKPLFYTNALLHNIQWIGKEVQGESMPGEFWREIGLHFLGQN